MRGRRPSGPEYVDGLAGSDLAKERLKVVLETLAGTMRVQDACRRLNVSEPRFYQLRLRVLEAALDRLEPRPLGRPARTLSPVEQEINTLQEQLAQARVHLQAAQAREEIALALPRLRRLPDAASEKKTTRRRPP
jgi:transposase